MNATALKFAALAAIMVGEAIMIAQQMIVAKAGKEHAAPTVWSLVLWSVIGVLLVLGGYYFGYLSFKNIWLVSVISVGSVLVAEVILAITLFGETPTLGAWVGLGFGIAGILATFLL